MENKVKFTFILYIILYSIGLIGRMANRTDAERFGIPVDCMFWLPTSEEECEITWYRKILPGLKLQLKI